MGKWEMVRLGDVCEINPKHQLLDDYTKLSFIPMANVSENGMIDISQVAVYKDVKKGFTSFIDGDVLFAKITPCMENGKGGIVKNLFNGVGFGSTEFHVLRNNPRKISSEWVFLFTHWSRFRKLAEVNMTGSAGQRRVPKSFLSDAKIPLPPLDEQKRIAKNLDLASEIVKGYKEQLAELDKLVQSVFYEMFGDPVTNEKGWEIQPLQSVCDVRDGTHDSPTYVRDGYPLVTSKNVKQGYIDFSTANLISHEDILKINLRSKVDHGDIIMPMIGTIGNPVIVNVNQEFAVKNVAIIKFAGSSMCNTFIKTLLSSSFFENAIQKANRGGTQKFIALGDIRKLSIPIPPPDTQTRFAEIVTDIEAQKAQIQQALTQAENLFNSLMQEYFE